MSTSRSRTRAAPALALLALTGCYRDFDLRDPPRADAGSVLRDAGSPDAAWVAPAADCRRASGVDLLFVMDSSGSMAEEQQSLVAELPRLVQQLSDPPDDDGDGAPDWPAVTDLRVGVITSDMGSAGFELPTCSGGTFGALLGDDGVLLTRGSTLLEGCDATYPSVLAFAGDTDAFVSDVACLTTVGTEGCGFEQPLEAALKALAPSRPQPYTRADYVPPTFFRGTFGHGSDANAGFVRDDTLLAIVVVTDEEDCSVRDPELLNPDSPTYTTDLNLRCFTYPEAAHPVERYVDQLLALRARRPDHLALAVIAGIPVETAVPEPTLADYEAMLAHPDMEERIDAEMPTMLEPSCNVPGRGTAFPPRRLVRTVAGLGEGRGTVQSICQEDFSPAIAPIGRLIARRACAEFEDG